MAETEVGGRTYYREEGQAGDKNVRAPIFDWQKTQEGQVGAKVHPGSIRGKETEVGYRNYHEEGQVGDKNVRAPIFDWQKTQEGQVGEKNVGEDILDSINFQEGQVGEKNVGADILDSINFQEGQVGALVHPSIRGKETEVGYKGFTHDTVNVASEYMTVDILINGLALVGVASLFYLGMNACQKQYQPIIAEAAEV